jgi:hypothetical protein
MLQFILIGIACILLAIAFVGFLAPDMSFKLAQQALTPEQVDVATTTLPYVQANPIQILPWVCIGFVLIIVAVVVAKR